jgi:hypothetical protein
MLVSVVLARIFAVVFVRHEAAGAFVTESSAHHFVRRRICGCTGRVRSSGREDMIRLRKCSRLCGSWGVHVVEPFFGFLIDDARAAGCGAAAFLSVSSVGSTLPGVGRDFVVPTRLADHANGVFVDSARSPKRKLRCFAQAEDAAFG